MFEYEEGYEDYYEPSELDEALEEFKDGIYKLLNRDISEQLESQSSKIIRLERMIAEQKDKINVLYKANGEIERDTKIKEMNIIIGDIKYGDVVYQIVNQRKERDCEYCDKGYISGNNNKKLKCPKCMGNGKSNYWEKEVQEKIVSKVKIHVETSYYKSNGHVAHRYYHVEGTNDSVHVYKTKEKADKELKKSR